MKETERAKRPPPPLTHTQTQTETHAKRNKIAYAYDVINQIRNTTNKQKKIVRTKQHYAFSSKAKFRSKALLAIEIFALQKDASQNSEKY